jgi:hypothetical protein
MPEFKMRRELEMQTKSTLEDLYSTVHLAGVSLDFVTTPENPPAWIGDHGSRKGGVSLYYHDTAPTVVLSISDDLQVELRRSIGSDRTVESVRVFDEMIEPIICNSGLEQIPPREAGLTSNPFILSDEIDRTDRGELRNLGRLIYFEPYQTRCPIKQLAEEGRVGLSIKA